VRVSVCWAHKSALRKEVEQIEMPFDGIDSRRSERTTHSGGTWRIRRNDHTSGGGDAGLLATADSSLVSGITGNRTSRPSV